MNKLELLKLSASEINKKILVVGTNYDRRRKLTNKDINGIRKMYKKRRAISDIALRYGVSCTTIKYHLFENYKTELNLRRKDYINNTIYSFDCQEELAEYKRNLILDNKRLKIVE